VTGAGADPSKITSESDHMATADVAAAKEGKVVSRDAKADLVRWTDNLQARADEASSEEFDSTAILAQQVTKIFAAETEEELDAADQGGTVAGKDFTDIAFQVNGYRLERESKFTTDLGVFTWIDGTVKQGNKKGFAIGDPVTINTGAGLVIAKLEWYRAHNALPKTCVLKATETRKGNTVLKLYSFDSPAVTTA
jgi:hypothetical protein